MRLLSVVQRYIGFDWNLASRTVALPPRDIIQDLICPAGLAPSRRDLFPTRCCQFAWKISSHILYFSAHLSFPAQHFQLHYQFQASTVEAPGPPLHECRPFMGSFPHQEPSQQSPTSTLSAVGFTMVRGCQHILQHWHCNRSLLGSLEMGSEFQGWPSSGVQY
jgi:hypothetical protein